MPHDQLDVWHSYFIVQHFLQMPQLRRLSLARNYLSGSIPTEIGHATKLRDLDLRDNKLTGVIQDTMKALSRLGTSLLLLLFKFFFFFFLVHILYLQKKIFYPPFLSRNTSIK